MSSRKRQSDTAVVPTTSANSAAIIDAPQNEKTLTSQEQQALASSSSSTSSSCRIRVRLKRFHGVAYWSWNANDEVCGICQFAFEGTAPGVKYPGEDCPVVWGRCQHAYHLQCISRWLSQPSSKNSCPICRQEWEFGQNSSSNTNTNNTNTTTTNNNNNNTNPTAPA